jgi:hypothetical protein
MHPFAFKHPRPSGGNSGAWNEVHAGEHVINLIDGQTGMLDECLHDGDALVTWDDGSFGTVKWFNLAPVSKVRVTGDRWEAILDMPK